jgi:hypothetical protein
MGRNPLPRKIAPWAVGHGNQARKATGVGLDGGAQSTARWVGGARHMGRWMRVNEWPIDTTVKCVKEWLVIAIREQVRFSIHINTAQERIS